ncbi:MAG: hypothetical protein ACLQNE_10845 [Thermoguttaceae bacterium]
MISQSDAIYAVAEYPGIAPADVHAAMACYFDNVEEIQDGFRKDEEWARWAEEHLPSRIPPEMNEKLSGRADPILFRRDQWESDCGAGFQPAQCRRDACTTTGPNHVRLARLVSWREGRLRGPSLPGRVPSRPWRSSENDPNQVLVWVELARPTRIVP